MINGILLLSTITLWIKKIINKTKKIFKTSEADLVSGFMTRQFGSI